MNVSEIKSRTAQAVMLDVILNYGVTYKEVEAHLSIKKAVRAEAVRELLRIGWIERFKVEGEREYRLRATLPDPIVEATILERCIKADEDDNLNAKVLVTLSEIESVFPIGSYEGKQPGPRQAIRWLAKMDDSAVQLYGLLEEARGRTLTDGGPINYVEAMIVNEAEPTFSELAANKARQKKLTDAYVAKELFKQGMQAV